MKTITHTNGEAVFSRCKKADQETAIRRFVVPTDEPYLYLDTHKRPFVQQPNSPKMYCTLRTNVVIGNGFHNHYVQK